MRNSELWDTAQSAMRQMRNGKVISLLSGNANLFVDGSRLVALFPFQRIRSTRCRKRIVCAAAHGVGLPRGSPRPSFRIPNSEFRIEDFAICLMQIAKSSRRCRREDSQRFYSAAVSAALRLAFSSSRMRVCSLSGSAYFHVGIAASSIPIAGGTEIRKNMAAANLPSL